MQNYVINELKYYIIQNIKLNDKTKMDVFSSYILLAIKKAPGQCRTNWIYNVYPQSADYYYYNQ